MLSVKDTTQIHLRSIYTEGKPYDSGRDLRELALSFEKSFSPFFESVKCLSARHLEQVVPGLRVRNYEAELQAREYRYPGIRYNPVWARVGFLGWKPAAILHSLESDDVPEDQLLVYRDVDIARYPEYLANRSQFVNWISRVSRNKDLIIFSDYSRAYSRDIRPDLLSEAPRPRRMESVFPLPVWAGLVIVRNNEMGREIIRSWSHSCTFENLVPFFDGPIPAEFIWHSGEQSMLSLLDLQLQSRPSTERSRVKKVYLFESRTVPPQLTHPRLFLSITKRILGALIHRFARVVCVKNSEQNDG